MGQYHVIANIDKRMGYSPRSTGSFVKLMEFGHTTGPLTALLLMLNDPNGWMGERIAILGDYAEDRDLGDVATEAAGISAEHIYRAVNDPASLPEGVDGAGWRNVGWLARKVLTEAGLMTFEKQDYTIVGRDGAGNSITHKGHNYQFEVTRENATVENPVRVVVNIDKGQVITPALLGDDPTLLDFACGGYSGGTLTGLAVLLGVSSVEGGRGGGDFRLPHPLVGSWGGERLAVVDPERAGGLEDITADLRTALQGGGEGRYTVSDSGVERAEEPWT